MNTRRLALAALVVIAGARLVAQRVRPFPVRVRGASMEPALHEGDLLLVTPAYRSPAPGDVVLAVRPDGVEIVKRVATVNDRGFVLLGDNPQASTDSRTLGPFPLESITGIARAAYWPPYAWKLL